MHEYQAVATLIDRLTDRLGEDRIREVRIRAAAVLSPEALQQAFEMLTKDTPLEGSKLVIEERADAQLCAECGASWVPGPDDLAGHLLVCPSCGSMTAVEADAGIEMIGVRAGEGT